MHPLNQSGHKNRKQAHLEKQKDFTIKYLCYCSTVTSVKDMIISCTCPEPTRGKAGPLSWTDEEAISDLPEHMRKPPAEINTLLYMFQSSFQIQIVLSLLLCEYSCSYCNLLAWKQLRHTCRGWWFEVVVGAAGLCWEDQICAGHQQTHIKGLKYFKTFVLTFTASVYARSCALTYTFLSCRVEGTHVLGENVFCLVVSALFSALWIPLLSFI